MRRPSLAILALVAAVAVAAPLPAAAQFFIDANLTSIGAPSCTPTGASGTTVGTIDFSLPATTDNAIAFLFRNGVLEDSFTSTLSPPVGSQVGGVYVVTIPSTPYPWTVSLEQYPALNGSRVGRGFRFTVSCVADGVGTASVTSVTASVPAVPVMPIGGLVLLSALLSLAAVVGHRRRTRRSR